MGCDAGALGKGCRVTGLEEKLCAKMRHWGKGWRWSVSTFFGVRYDWFGCVFSIGRDALLCARIHVRTAAAYVTPNPRCK